MSRNRLTIGIVATAAFTSSASADFFGFSGNVEVVGDYTVIKMYALYDQADIALNVFNAQIESNNMGEFNHSDVQIGAGGTFGRGSRHTVFGSVGVGFGVGGAGGDDVGAGGAGDGAFPPKKGGLGALGEGDEGERGGAGSGARAWQLPRGGPDAGEAGGQLGST